MLAYQASDLHIERGAVPLALTGAMREELMHQREYHDRYVPGWTYHGKGRTAPYPMLYMPPDALFASDAFGHLRQPGDHGVCARGVGPGGGGQLGLGVDQQSRLCRLPEPELAPRQFRAAQFRACLCAPRHDRQHGGRAHGGDRGHITSSRPL
jgi:hypothetical protein